MKTLCKMSIAHRTSKEYTFDLVIEILKIYISNKSKNTSKRKTEIP